MRISHRIDSSVAESEEDTPGTCRRSASELAMPPKPRSIGPTATPITIDPSRNATAEAAQTGPIPRGRTAAAGRATFTAVALMDYSRASADDIARKKLTSRGPQRDAIESWIRTIDPVRTALMRSQPGREATVDGFCPQQTVSARTIRSGPAETMYSAESCGNPVPAESAASAMFSRPSAAYTFPTNDRVDAE